MLRLLVLAVCGLVAAARNRFLQEAESRPCGSGWLQNLVLPQGFGRADFRPCCLAHDACYGTCGADKGGCDAQFEACAEEKCKVYDEPGLEIAAKELCQESAQSGLNLLSLDPADQAFSNAQARVCPAQRGEEQTGAAPAPGRGESSAGAQPTQSSDASSGAEKVHVAVTLGLLVLAAMLWSD